MALVDRLKTSVKKVLRDRFGHDRDRLHWVPAWNLDVAACPCDAHFLEYLRERGLEDQTIFHFGTGAHHMVGRALAEAPRPSDVLGVTASPEEHQAYEEYISRNSKAARYYKVMLVDVYTLAPRIMPEFDLVTLFHLCEFFDETVAPYARIDDPGLVEMFVGKLRPGGRLLFYRDSRGFGKTRPILEDMVAKGRIAKTDEYKSLLVYARAP